jgi:hypothetical protein
VTLQWLDRAHYIADSTLRQRAERLLHGVGKAIGKRLYQSRGLAQILLGFDARRASQLRDD